MPRFLPAPDPAPERRSSERPLPAYRYVPGVHPHPFRDPQGHSFRDGSAPTPPPLGSGPLADHPAFRWGLELYAWGYYWEAHEAWEGLWVQLPRGERQATLLQGLIQLAAARLKAHMGHAQAAHRLMRSAAPRLRMDHPEVQAAELWEEGWAAIQQGG